MKDPIKQFLDKRLPLPGLLAWGTRLPDGEVVGNGYNDRFRASQIGEFLKIIGGMCQMMSEGNAPGTRFCWNFQLAKVFVATCSDGTALALFFRNEERIVSDAISNLLSDFELLDLGVAE